MFLLLRGKEESGKYEAELQKIQIKPQMPEASRNQANNGGIGNVESRLCEESEKYCRFLPVMDFAWVNLSELCLILQQGPANFSGLVATSGKAIEALRIVWECDVNIFKGFIRSNFYASINVPV
jgi:hypothetical protein